VSLSFIAEARKQTISVIAITSKSGTRDPKAKTRERGPASPIRSRVPGFSCPLEIGYSVGYQMFSSKYFRLKVRNDIVDKNTTKSDYNQV